MRPTILPRRLQLFEIGLAAVGIYLALHLEAKVSGVLVGAAIAILLLALCTTGPLSVVRRFSPVTNLAVLSVIGFIVVATPAAFAWARSASAILTLEGGGVLIVATIVAVVRRPVAPLVAPESARPGATGPSPSLSPALRSASRAAGRVSGAAGRVGGAVGGRAAGQVPIAARRAGRIAGAIRGRRR